MARDLIGVLANNPLFKKVAGALMAGTILGGGTIVPTIAAAQPVKTTVDKRVEQRGRATIEVTTTTTVRQGVTAKGKTSLLTGDLRDLRGVQGTDEGNGKGAAEQVVKRTLADLEYERSLMLDRSFKVLLNDTVNAEGVVRNNGQYVYWKNEDGSYTIIHGIKAAKVVEDDSRDGYRKIWLIRDLKGFTPSDPSDNEKTKAEIAIFVKRSVNAAGTPATIGEINVKVEAECVAGCNDTPPPPPPEPPVPPTPPTPPAEPMVTLDPPSTPRWAATGFAGYNSGETKIGDASTYVGVDGEYRVIPNVTVNGTLIGGQAGQKFGLEEITVGAQLNNRDNTLAAGVTAGQQVAGQGVRDELNPAGNRGGIGQAAGNGAITGNGLSVQGRYDISPEWKVRGEWTQGSGDADFNEFGGSVVYDGTRIKAGVNGVVGEATSVDGNEGVDRTYSAISVQGSYDIREGEGGLYAAGAVRMGQSETTTPVKGFGAESEGTVVDMRLGWQVKEGSLRGTRVQVGPSYETQTNTYTCPTGCGPNTQVETSGWGFGAEVVVPLGSKQPQYKGLGGGVFPSQDQVAADRQAENNRLASAQPQAQPVANFRIGSDGKAVMVDAPTKVATVAQPSQGNVFDIRSAVYNRDTQPVAVSANGLTTPPELAVRPAFRPAAAPATQAAPVSAFNTEARPNVWERTLEVANPVNWFKRKP